MDGVFVGKRWNLFLWMAVSFGGLCIVQYCSAVAVGEKMNAQGVASLLVMGILCGAIGVFFGLMNRGAYIRIGEDYISAKYHWFGRLDCRIDDVAFAQAQINALMILLKSGKRHVVAGVANAGVLCAAIRRQIFAVEKESPDTLRQRLSQAQAKRRKALGWMLVAILLLFVNIIITVWLTDGRDLHEFSQRDWVIFSIMGVIELATVIGLFCAAHRYGKLGFPIQYLEYRLRGATIATHPLPTERAIAVYTDENYLRRVVVCGFPNEEQIYICVQEHVGNDELHTAYTSEIIASTEEIEEGAFSQLMDISECFIKQ